MQFSLFPKNLSGRFPALSCLQGVRRADFLLVGKASRPCTRDFSLIPLLAGCGG